MTLPEVPGTCTYLDELFCSGAIGEKHARRMEIVQDRLKTTNQRVNCDKYKLEVPEFGVFGQKVHALVTDTTGEKVHAIVETPSPTSKQGFQAFLGL